MISTAKSIVFFSLLFTSLSLIEGVYAEDIDLFDQNRGQVIAKPSPVKKTHTYTAPKKRPIYRKTPSFYLTGISRFGHRYTLYFINSKRKLDKVIWLDNKQAEQTTLYDDYSIIKVKDRMLYLQLNKGQCHDDQTKGISCDTKHKQMLMSIVKRTRIVPRQKNKRLKKVITTRQLKTQKTSPLSLQ